MKLVILPSLLSVYASVNVNPLGAISIHIWMYVPTTHCNEHTYMQAIQRSAYCTEFYARNQCGINPCLLSSKRLGHTTFHLHHYPDETGRRSTNVSVIINFDQGCQKQKLFLEWTEQTASSFHIRQKYYLQITLKWAETVKAVSN